MAEFLLGIDGGTECIKSGIFDLEGNQIAISKYDYDTYYEHPGWAEQKISDWKAGLVHTIKEVIAKAGLDAKDICGVSYDATSCTVIFLDEDNRPLRNAIMWMDVRASKEARFVSSIDDPARKYNGYGPVSPEWFVCKNLWVKNNQPDVYKDAKIIAEYDDWLTHELTGVWTVGISTASIRGYYDSRNGGWQEGLFNKLGLEELIDKLPEKVLRTGEYVGGISRDIAKQTGLIEGTPVGQGATDAISACIGSNAFGTGQVFFIAGSSNYLQVNVGKEFHTRGLFGSYPDLVIDNFFVEGGQTSTGSVLKWYKNNFINPIIEDDARKEGLAIYGYMDKQAQKIPPGSEGVIVLEHFQGNRTPFTDPESRGIIRGLSLKTTPFHVYRAIMEGCAYGTETTLQVMKENGFKIDEIVACGGHMKSPIWTQIYSDVTGLPLKCTVNAEATVLGSAIQAAVASGKYENITDAAEHMVRFKEEVIPDPKNHKIYSALLKEYIATYKNLKESTKKVNEISRDL